MRHLRSINSASIMLLILLAACAPQTAPTPLPPTVPAVQQTNTVVPFPTQPVATATLVPIVLSGPPMEVGSSFQYVDGSILVAVPGGPFTMGHGGSDNPEHIVTLSDFWIYKAKVVNQQYALCVNAGKCTPPDQIDDFTFGDATHANDPVVGVTWTQASDYCSFVHGQLPTEAQWEKTARGPDGNLYPWGNNAPICDVLNFNNCVGKLTDVTKYPQGQSYYKALDMEGNTFEWVADWYNALYYRNGPAEDPLGPDTGKQRSVRSSSYKSKADQTPASTRFYSVPSDHRRDLGFRCVVVDPTYFAPACQSIGSFGSSNTSLQPDCPKVNIGLTPVCQKGIVTVTITDDHTNDPNAVVSGVGPCSPVSVTPGVFPQIYNCSSSTAVSIDSKCVYTESGSVQCAPHYKLNTQTDICEWDGTGTKGGQCLPGETYDPVNLCCSSQTQGGYPVCPLGTTLGYVPPGNVACVPNGQALNQPHHSEFVSPQDPSTCTGGGNPGGGCPNGQTYTCVPNPDPKCSRSTTAPCPPICSCQ
jgi:formylglycine-generating enzyme required for sulfatase activity